MEKERFVSAQVAADFLSVSRRFLLSLARQGIVGAYPWGPGSVCAVYGCSGFRSCRWRSTRRPTMETGAR